MEEQLFKARDDWWNNACLNFASDGWELYATGYKEAADVLAQRAREGSCRLDVLIYPIAFLYRHYLELRLKQMIISGEELLGLPGDLQHDHDLKSLWRRSRGVLEKVWPDSCEADLNSIERCVLEFSKTDPRSMSFRYPITKTGDPTLAGITHINIDHLREVVNECADLLDGASLGISAYLQDKLSSHGS